jgi:hypothetical protein
MVMSTGDAMRLISEFGFKCQTESFMQTIEVLDLQDKLGLLSPILTEAYQVVIGEAEEVAKMSQSA